MQHDERGFTLIELGVVIAVLSILAGVVLPDFIELARNEKAKQAALHVAELQDKAKLYYHQTVQADDDIDPWNARWPGEIQPQTCPAGAKPLDELVAEHIIEKEATRNPWEIEVKMSLLPGGGSDAAINNAVCRLRVVTEVPEKVSGVVETYLPGGVCGDDCGSAKAGFKACCSSVPKPGLEASLQQAVSQVDDKVVEAKAAIAEAADLKAEAQALMDEAQALMAQAQAVAP
ncbi:MAG: hypothetical protein A2289_12980 [Deltaproteobacteria bacterium RIFOXYA12_FULL_58_15]|nr:MAG: hypothetical protein A2289_12980 [Deltaproteobacteria bacterium RIFOXYA12_FULL_58_15]OGR10154.1 MAG: hypothetical protein A2341_06185 [Deltaproteobacteria bacterium RIFOXYB12_FULL_58_9]